jgi:hypothetical protein
MSNCLHDMGHFSAAEDLQRETISRLRKTLGDLHPDALACQSNLAVTLRASGRTDDATVLQQQVAAVMARVLGDDHPNLLALRRWDLLNRDLEPQPT